MKGQSLARDSPRGGTVPRGSRPRNWGFSVREGQSLTRDCPRRGTVPLWCRIRVNAVQAGPSRLLRSYLVCVPRVPRCVLPDGVFHVTCRGVGNEPIYCDDDDRLLFVDLLHATGVRFEWEFHAWCLMTNHYHLLVGSTREKLSLGLHRLNGLYAQRFNRRHRRKGHLFGDRFWASVVEDRALPGGARLHSQQPRSRRALRRG